MNFMRSRKSRFPLVLMVVFAALSLALFGCTSDDAPSVDTTAPSQPQGLSATAVSAAQIDLTWTASTDNRGVTGYKIHRDGVVVATSKTTSFSDTGLTASTTYTYKVCAYDAAGNDSLHSAEASATTMSGAGGDTEAPSVPANLQATATSATTVDLTWDASTDNVGVTGYKIFRDSVEVDSSATNSYSDSGLTANTDYAYEVSAYDAAGNESAKSAAANVTTPASGLTQATNIFLDSILPNNNYTMFHGSASPDGSKLLVSVNESTGPQTGANGTIDLYILDAADLETGAVTLLDQGQVVGDGSGPWGATISFRSNWSADGSKIALSAADRIFILDAATLTPTNGANGDINIGGQTHDAMFTDDAAYAVMTLRTKPYSGADASKMDGELQLYDVAAGQAVGNSVSVCNGCHTSFGLGVLNATLCGLDGAITDQGNGTYAGTIYVAGHGGHFAKVNITIDPSNTTDPIGVSLSKQTVSMVKFAEGDSQYKLHDARLDGTTLYWSTYNTDANGQVHYGKVNLATSAVTDVAVDVDARATIPGVGLNKMPIYCASGQTANYFMPITMTNEAYITVIPKNTITASTAPPPVTVKTATNVFLDSIVPVNYNMFHGSTSNDGTKMLVNVNQAAAPGGALNGTVDLYILDLADMEKATVTQVAGGSVSGDNSGPGGATISFRSDWSSDDSLIALAGGDRIWIVDSSTLAPTNGANGDINIGGQIHDALFTSDDAYAIMTLRTNLAGPKDGKIQLYDVAAGQAVGNAVSVCDACHTGVMGTIDSTLCGLDGDVQYVAPGYGGSATYTGTIYVAGHGGHFAVADITVDPSNTTDPITVNSLNRLTISMTKFAGGEPGAGTSQYKLHDARLDGNTLYWSTYNTDASGQLHYGKVNLATSAVTDKAIDVDARATIPDRSVEGRNKMPMYCASGQSSRMFMPITMTHEAYITVIPKLGVN
ncbi:MAG: hypothetical protein Kow0025_14240 [Thermodesulfovibrionales bacterium]